MFFSELNDSKTKCFLITDRGRRVRRSGLPGVPPGEASWCHGGGVPG